ncbi:excinuclease ABC subunit UvrA [Streptomyces sp. SID3343]|uniref:ATP-binding cassette domain-containing protein n=1 Tax=Streptomyces sp. SID3343 TaxID=2690260 RepID=UPI00136F3D89|nr:excinuclease ABC subunit UvrA [Streptomyces sp. SID3343]MYV99222.1 ATP-binding cassette domain-containing protein [Streptomyces sp. SID3343]
MSNDSIVITGAREHNLKNVSLTIPKNRIVVFTGVSGSGKSSIVFDTIAVESQRQLNETFPMFVRNRMPKHERPDADSIEHLSTAIVVDQRPVGGNSRSTVGTMTDVHPLLRVLFSRHGTPSAGPSNHYSFNDPHGMCPNCDGLGRTVRLDLAKLIDPTRSIQGGAIRHPSFAVGGWQWQLYSHHGLYPTDVPVGEFTAEQRHLFLHGTGAKVEIVNSNGRHHIDYEGFVDRFERLYLKRDTSALSERSRETIARYVTEGPCPRCEGARLNAAALASRIEGHSISDYAAMEIGDLVDVLTRIEDPATRRAARPAAVALERLVAIGLGYLNLDRPTSTVSGGEGQRLKMVRYLGSSLTGLTYVFDEPSVGLHPRDVVRLNDLLTRLRDKGNTVLVVEHDLDVIAVADHVVDVGPGAGIHGGTITFEGTFEDLRVADSPTGHALRRLTPLKPEFRTPTGALEIRGANAHNLRGVDVDIPTGVLSVVTGVAGSGKSTLITDVLVAAHPDAVVVDQSGVGKSSRSTPASYVGVLDLVRKLFAKAHGVDVGLFTFNSLGACPECAGRGVIHTDMAFMDPVTTRCEACRGRRFKDEVLAYKLRGKSIVDVLASTAEEAVDYFTEKALRTRVETLVAVGLGYLTLGQPLSSLSGGELQRLKLASELHKTGNVYILDEPTTGLHMSDVDTLVRLLDRLVDAGNTVVVVEHNLDVIKRADHVLDLGPGGGKHGGTVVFEGTPAELVKDEGSVTAQFLRAALEYAERARTS